MSKEYPLQKDQARVIINTHKSTDGMKFSLDMNFSKANALQILVYALRLKETEETPNEVAH